MQNKILIIGVDGGATKVVAHVVRVDEAGFFELGKSVAQRQYLDYPEFDRQFIPVPLATQLADMQQGFEPTDEELKQSSAYLQAFTDVIREIAESENQYHVLIGMGMPGLKTTDKRGIAALANGPRMPHFCDLLEEKLAQVGVHLVSPVHKLGSDADYCGMGETYALDGSFRNVNNAYYLGGGTGVADAMVLNGDLLAFDDAKPWIAKTWEFKSSGGYSLERYISAKGVQFLYGESIGISTEELDKKCVYGQQILEMAQKGDKKAAETIAMVSGHLAKLLFERISTLYFGWQSSFEFINVAKTLDPEHPFKGTLLDRIVIGQRLGDWLGMDAGAKMLLEPLTAQLETFILSTKEEEFIQHYLSGNKLKKDLIALSSLRAAPALGAGADAFLNYQKRSTC